MDKWRPRLAELEFTQLTQYSDDCALARTVLVEHDITFDLYHQMLQLEDDGELRRQAARWSRFESAARRRVERDFDWDNIARRQARLYRELM